MAVLFGIATLAAAQGHDMREEMKKKMDEISRLMRESEKLLLEITKVDRLVAQQQEIVRELEGLVPPPRDDAAAQAAHEKKVDELKRQQSEAARRLSELFDGQRQRAETTVRQLEQLLKNWPKQRRQGQPQDQKSKEQKEREKRLREKQNEQKQNQPQSPRDKKDLLKDKPERGDQRPKDDKQSARSRRHIEAWIASLPPMQQERISRGDLSDIPSRYRRLVREYTALRAKREAESKDENR
jgi:hypothetical protein